MRKIVIISFLGIFLASCSLTRNRGKSNSEYLKKFPTDNILESVKSQNITNEGFFIQKAEIEVITQDVKEKFISSIKFEKPDKYLISIKSRTGIEGARIYISEDSIMINDRINKKVYFGTSLYVKRNYGLNQSVLPLIFGDIVVDKSCVESREKCLENKLNLQCSVKGVRLDYNIDCKKRKIALVYQMENDVQKGIKIVYERFFNVGNIIIPARVEFKDSETKIDIKIKILKVVSPWNGSVKFIPGKGYELKELV